MEPLDFNEFINDEAAFNQAMADLAGRKLSSPEPDPSIFSRMNPDAEAQRTARRAAKSLEDLVEQTAQTVSLLTQQVEEAKNSARTAETDAEISRGLAILSAVIALLSLIATFVFR